MSVSTPLPHTDSDTPAASGPLSPEALRLVDGYWRAANYLSVGRSICWTTRC